ncbi:class I SAM-dependent methyltransferase [Vandammella animalimorsus]|uniref:Methyltransferase n=1 Tax=Vandammella animalimorsus TaxID=2029117 RepID=A0A2A2B0I7_9BURK|nr:methyltransferase domain-containing protein [Vandammella animalimorsus]PAT43531.1 methyltransferase [Vandammella animalimorsus]
MDLKETDILGDSIDQHWYYRSKALAMKRLLDDKPCSSILDVGAGSGFFSKQLLSSTNAKEAWCVDISYENEFDATEAGKPIHFRKSIDSVSADIVLLMDVLEHVDDDTGLLQEYVAKVPSGARFIISVPAFQFLWSSHDVFLEHRRRYKVNQIENVARRAGLNIQYGSYYFGAVFPIAASIRLTEKIFHRSHRQTPRSQLTQHHPLVNATLATMCAIELPLLKINRLAGLTVFCVAEKP